MRARKLSGNKHTKNNRGKELHKSYSEKEKGRSCPFRDNSFKDIIEMSINSRNQHQMRKVRSMLHILRLAPSSSSFPQLNVLDVI